MKELTVFEHNHVDVVDSRQVAEMIGKTHAHLMRDIQGYVEILKKSKEAQPMFYILHKRKLIPIDPDRIYTFCPRCGTLHAVDPQAEISDGDCYLLTPGIYCDDCSAAVRAKALAATEKEE